MIEYENVKDALKALYELNNATEITIKDMETGETRQAEVDDTEDKNTVAIHDGITRGNPNQTIINESGLYSLILSSKLPPLKLLKKNVKED